MYSMVMPTIWEFMREDLGTDSKPALGALLSVYPALQVAGFLLVGRWSDRRGSNPNPSPSPNPNPSPRSNPHSNPKPSPNPDPNPSPDPNPNPDPSQVGSARL